VEELHGLGPRVSIFVGPDVAMIEGAAAIGADRIELYTEPYAAHFFANKAKAIAPFKLAAERAYELGLGLNAGHDLDLDNLAYLKQELPNLLEVSIGHALVCDSLTWGLQNTIGMYLRQLQ
jgi:pyridoxine 5-phosphate synthase